MININASPATLEEARHQANLMAKAVNLAKRGYTGRWLTGDMVEITHPAGHSYRLDLMEQTCECVGYQEHGMCSHLLGYYPLVCAKEKPDA